MEAVLESLLLTLVVVTAVSSGGNLAYFLRYRAARRKRRLGATVLALVSLAGLAQALATGLALTREVDVRGWSWLFAGSLSCAASLAVSLIILRSLLPFSSRR